MGRRRRLRLVAFALAAAALVAAGLFIRGEGTSPGLGDSDRTYRAGRRAALHEEEERALSADAARYFAAFLRYEQGDTGRKVVRQLRLSASATFANELLQAPPRVDGALGRPRLEHIRIDEVSWRPPIAIVTALARRAQARERLSFLFAKREGRWLAAGPAP